MASESWRQWACVDNDEAEAEAATQQQEAEEAGEVQQRWRR